MGDINNPLFMETIYLEEGCFKADNGTQFNNQKSGPFPEAMHTRWIHRLLHVHTVGYNWGFRC